MTKVKDDANVSQGKSGTVEAGPGNSTSNAGSQPAAEGGEKIEDAGDKTEDTGKDEKLKETDLGADKDSKGPEQKEDLGALKEGSKLKDQKPAGKTFEADSEDRGVKGLGKHMDAVVHERPFQIGDGVLVIVNDDDSIPVLNSKNDEAPGVIVDIIDVTPKVEAKEKVEGEEDQEQEQPEKVYEYTVSVFTADPDRPLVVLKNLKNESTLENKAYFERP